MLNWFLRRAVSLATGVLGFLILIMAGTHVWLAAVAVVTVLLPVLFVTHPSKKPVVTEEPMPVRVPVIDALEPLMEVKAAFAGFDSPAYLLDIKANVIFQNNSARHLLGPIDVGQHISARIRQPAILDMIRETLSSGQNGQTEYAATLPTEGVFQVRCVPARGADRRVSFYVLIFRDISESRRIDRMRTDFVANASHELRTPLASLRGFIETLLGPARSDAAAQQKFLSIMLEQVTRMSRLVDDLMSLSRLELKARLAPEDEVDLVPLIGSVCDALSPLADDLGVDFKLDLPDYPVTVSGDRDELTQVFENLIENACKYGQDGKVVEVTLSEAAGEPVDVSITDHGPGIPEDQVPRLTERFYRVNVESSRSKKGTGLGLAIVKHILTRHRARLLIRSALGQGSTFTVRFQPAERISASGRQSSIATQSVMSERSERRKA